MRTSRLFKNRQGDALLPGVYGDKSRHEVVAPVSRVRIGEISREHVKSKQSVDYPRWVTLYVGKTRGEATRWLDKHMKTVIKLCTPYEVGRS